MIPVRGFEDKTVAVFGLGRTGLTAARALIAGGAKVALWDEKSASREAAAAEGFPVVDLQAADWSQFAALMLSPGVPLTHPKPHWTVEKARAAGVEVLGDVELFARTVNAAPAHKRPKIIAITGTNGKSTTTALIGHLCASAGRDTRVGGNIGLGVLGLEDMHGGAVYVLELSSYQLDLTSSLKPDAVVLLNISPDHLDRHGGMDGYIAAKRRIFLNQGKGDTAIIGVDDAWCQQICTEITAANRRTIWPISAGKAMGRGVYALQGVLYDATGERVVEVADILRARSLPGRHNWQNAAAAYAAQVLHWDRTNRFCGACGRPTVPAADPAKRAKVCEGCGHEVYPRVSPCTITAIHDGARMLLVRAPHFPPGRFGLVAGFVDPGESLEDCVRREAREEVGLELAEVTYLGSQPWPFPHQLMVGFVARAEPAEPRLLDGELAEAGWFAPDALPQLPPRLSIARALIEHVAASLPR